MLFESEGLCLARGAGCDIARRGWAGRAKCVWRSGTMEFCTGRFSRHAIGARRKYRLHRCLHTPDILRAEPGGPKTTCKIPEFCARYCSRLPRIPGPMRKSGERKSANLRPFRRATCALDGDMRSKWGRDQKTRAQPRRKSHAEAQRVRGVQPESLRFANS
jgi:hypothetical protein